MKAEDDTFPEQDASSDTLAAERERFRALLEAAPPSPALRARVERTCVSVRRAEPRRRWAFLSAGLAAAVVVSASVWLFVHLLATPLSAPLAEGPDSARTTPGGDGEDDAAKQQQEKEIDELIAKLDSENFAVRKDAHEALVGMGMSARAQVVRRLAQAQDMRNPNANLAAELDAILHRIDTAHRAFVVAEAQRELDRAMSSTLTPFVPPDPELLARLQAKVSVTSKKDESPRAWLAAAAEEYNLPILIDAQVFPPPANNVFEGDLQLNANGWPLEKCLREATGGMGADMVVRGEAVIVTSQEKAQRLRMNHKTLVLPGVWSLEETRTLARILEAWPVQKRLKEYKDPTFQKAEILRAGSEEAGKVQVVAEDWSWPLLEALAKSFAPGAEPFDTDYRIWSESKLKRWKELEALIDTEIEGPLPEQRWAVILHQLAAEAKTTFVAESEDWKPVEDAVAPIGAVVTIAGPSPTGHEQYLFSDDPAQLEYILTRGGGMNLPKFGVANKRVAIRKVLQDASERLALSVSVGPRWHLWVVKPKTRFSGMDAQPFVLDLREALKAGVPEKALMERLSGLLRQAALKPEGFVLRGRWLAAADPWTYQRAIDLVERAVKEKRLPAEDPPSPWFFATFPKR